MEAQLFDMVLNNSVNFCKEINVQFLKTLNLNGNDKFREYLQASIEQFGFNVTEVQFIEEVKSIVSSELKRIEASLRDGRPVNYEEIQASLIKRLQSVRYPNISLNDDFRTLSKAIVQKFPSANTENEFYDYFMKNKEKIKAMIVGANQNLVGALVNLTPNLMDNIKNNVERQKNKVGVSQSESAPRNLEQTGKEGKTRNAYIQTVINGIIVICKNKKEDLNKAFYDETFDKEKSQIARVLRQINNLEKELSVGVYDALLQNIMTEAAMSNFISERIPQLEETLHMIHVEKEKSQDHDVKSAPLDNSRQVPLQQESVVEPKQPTENEKVEPSYALKREQIVNNFIGVYAAAYINDVVEKVYPYILDLADVSSRREEIRASFDIPAYPLSEDELTEIINRINAIVRNYIITQMDSKMHNASVAVSTNNSENDYYLDGFSEEGPKFSH